MSTLDAWLGVKPVQKSALVESSKKKAKKRKFNVRNFIDDECEGNGIVEQDEKLLQEEGFDDVGPKEYIKKVPDAESQDEESGEDFYEIDPEAEKEQDTNIGGTRNLFHRQMLEREEKELALIEQRMEDEQKLANEQKQALKVVIERQKVFETRAKPLLIKKPLVSRRKVALQEVVPTRRFDCVWRADNNRYLVHWVGADRLVDMTFETNYSGFQKKCNTTWTMLYPFSSFKDFLLLQRFAPLCKWFDFWIKSFDSLPTIPAHLRNYIEEERYGVLAECLDAFWLCGDGFSVLAHFVFDKCDASANVLSTAFHVVHMSLCPDLFTREQRRLIMTPDVIARYPWKSADEALALLQANAGDALMTYQELKRKMKLV